MKELRKVASMAHSMVALKGCCLAANWGSHLADSMESQKVVLKARSRAALMAATTEN